MGINPELIKQHNPIEDVISRYYELTGRGAKLSTKENPSITINTDKQLYHDFGGDNDGGSVIDFIMQYESLDFLGACEFLSADITDTTPAPAPRVIEETKPSYNQKNIQAYNKRDLTPANAIEGLRELYPFINNAQPFMHLLGYSNRDHSLTIELKDVTVVRRSGDTKWKTFGSKKYIPFKINKDDKYVFLYSGMAEIIAVEAMRLSYIGLQADGMDGHITEEILSACKGKTIVVLEENDKSSQELSQRLRKQFQDVKIIAVGAEKQRGYDFRDFVNDMGAFTTAKDMLIRMADMTKCEERQVTDEIIVPYVGQFIADQDEIDISSLSRCVIVAKTGSGKTYSFEDQPGVMILVPRVKQTDTGKGDDTDYVLNKVMSEGATLTFEKFIGHYMASREFKHYVESKKFKVVVDEAHMIQDLKRGYEIIYGLDAVFMSGTLEKFFRKDLQRYKFKPEYPTILYYTKGVVPDFDNALYFGERPKAFMRNYPKNCVVGNDHNFDNFNVHQYTGGKVFSTSALREGVSIKGKQKSGTFDACVVDASLCGLWSVKDTIQALNRPRGNNVLRVVSKPIEAPVEIFDDLDWFLNKARKLTDTQEINTIMGEQYSKFIKKTHKGSRYLAATEFGVVCYLADRTRNNYDTDLYQFEEYDPTAEFEIDTSTDTKIDEDVEMLEHTIGDDIYQYPANKRDPFLRWARHKESGLVDKLVKMKDPKCFNDIYLKSSVAKDIKAKYNKMFNRGKKPKSYSINHFYKLVSKVVKLEITDGEKDVQRVSKHTDIKEVNVRVISECPIKGVKFIGSKEFKTKLFTIKEQALNCTSKPHHSANRAVESVQPDIDPILAIKTPSLIATSAPKKEPTKPPSLTARMIKANKDFLDDISELT